MKRRNPEYYDSVKSMIRHEYCYSSKSFNDLSLEFKVSKNYVYELCRELKRIWKEPDFGRGMLIERIIGNTDSFYESQYTSEDIYNAMHAYHGTFDKNIIGLKSKV